MPQPNNDPLAALLDETKSLGHTGKKTRIEMLYGDRPDVLDAIRRARAERRLSFRQISQVLSSEGESISEGSVQKWLRSQGIE